VASFKNSTVQEQFKTSVASAMSGVEASDIYIVNIVDKAQASPYRRLSTLNIEIHFAVSATAGVAQAAFATMQNSTTFLSNVAQALISQPGALSLASIITQLFAPPLVSSKEECPAGNMPILSTTPWQLAPGLTWRLRKSYANEILLLQAEEHADQFSPFLGRSYSGRDWESSPGALPLFSCCSLWCAIQLPISAAPSNYTLWKVPSAHVAATVGQSSNASISRFLTQATFGPTRASIAGMFQCFLFA
jgi:hypothetical protein